MGGCARLPPMCTGLISSLLFVLVPAPGFFLRFSSLHKNQHFLNCDAIWKQWMRSHFMEMPLQIPIYLIIINFSIFNRPLPARTSLLYPCMLRILSFKALNLISPCRFPVSRVNRAQKKVPSNCLAQVDFPSWQVTFHSYLPDGQAGNQASHLHVPANSLKE